MRTLLAVLLLLPNIAGAQVGSFVATLGRDTMHLERFVRRGNVVQGVIVTRVPQTRVLRYTMTFDKQGAISRYDFATEDAAGVPLRGAGAAGSLIYVGDTIIRTTIDKGENVEQKIPAPNGAFPGPAIPYVGVTYLIYEEAFKASRRRNAQQPDSSIYLLSMFASQRQPQRSRIWVIGSDSAELDYFGVARSGYRFDSRGQLIRADWRGTTYRYQITRGGDIDVPKYISRWGAEDKAGKGMGALSPRDTARFRVHGATMLVDYSRPSARGRSIWGDVVQSGRVWRLGADMATHVSIDSALTLGDVSVPAGRYTLWMLLQEDGSGLLVVNNRVNIFGTQYNPASDLVRIPMRRASGATYTERLTISVDGNNALTIAWGDAMFTVPVARGVR